jgi:hypothetical protein
VNNQERGDALPPLAPVWADPPKGSAFGPAFIFFVAAIVTGVVYLLAKNFLFAES